MDKDAVMRRALGVSVIYNFVGAFLLAFPSSSLGQLAGVPTPVPPTYRALAGFFVALFGGAYAWLARQREIDRPLVALSIIGKGVVFAIIVVFWLVGQGPGRGVVAGTGDLVLAGIFAWWLFASR